MADVIVIGAGASGAVLASRLSEDPEIAVLLLEAGGEDRSPLARVPAAFSRLFKSSVDWDVTTTPQGRLDDRSLYWPRGKVVGGSTTINAMMWVRGNPADYDAWAAAGCDGWGYDDLLEHFTAAEDTERAGGPEVGIGGPLSIREQRDPNPATFAFLDACVASGIAHNHHPNERGNVGVSLTQVTQRRGLRHSVAAAYLAPARRRDNLSVVTDAHVERVAVSDGRAVAVEYRDGDGVDHSATARREVVVCAGAVNTPQVLMLSGIGPADHLREHDVEVVADRAEVGAGLFDHLASAVIARTDRSDTLVAAERFPNFVRLAAGRGPLTSNVAEAHAFVHTVGGRDRPDVELVFAPVPYVDHALQPPSRHAYTIGVVLLDPRSRGTVRLRDADPRSPVVVDPRYLSAEGDLDTLVRGLRRAQDLFHVPPLADLVTGPMIPDRWLDTDDEWHGHVARWAETIYHPAGTARMGGDDDAVVDPALRVRGVDGLRVADASIMPGPVTGHTTAAAVMIGEKAARLLGARAS